ncbi:hypothetical protein LEMLEM_LOCUS15149, partial [Lemmus lemmus]
GRCSIQHPPLVCLLLLRLCPVIGTEPWRGSACLTQQLLHPFMWPAQPALQQAQVIQESRRETEISMERTPTVRTTKQEPGQLSVQEPVFLKLTPPIASFKRITESQVEAEVTLSEQEDTEE